MIQAPHFLVLPSALLIANCGPNPLREETVTTSDSDVKIETVKEDSLTYNATGIVEKHWEGAWSPRSIGAGNSTVIRIYRRSVIIGTFDGLSHSEILIQLPASPVVGRRYPLVAASGSRNTKKDQYGNTLAELKVGEVSAYRFGNPVSGELKEAEDAWVSVLSVDTRRAEIHLRLKADLEPRFEFDIDEKFTLGIAQDVGS